MPDNHLRALLLDRSRSWVWTRLRNYLRITLRAVVGLDQALGAEEVAQSGLDSRIVDMLRDRRSTLHRGPEGLVCKVAGSKALPAGVRLILQLLAELGETRTTATGCEVPLRLLEEKLEQALDDKEVAQLGLDSRLADFLGVRMATLYLGPEGLVCKVEGRKVLPDGVRVLLDLFAEFGEIRTTATSCEIPLRIVPREVPASLLEKRK
jgi:hypothetical protein